MLSQANLLAAGDWLARSGWISPELLLAYVSSVHFDGVRRARRVAPLVNPAAESVRESILRWIIHWGGLPTPVVNADIHDETGAFLARGDLSYPQWKVLVEYDGWHHERDALQRQRDLLRRERLEAAGWSIVVVTAEDLRHPAVVVNRIRSAIRRRGYLG